MGSGRKSVIDILFTLALFCVFTVACIIVIYIGADVYSRTVEQTEAIFETNTSVTYVSARIRQHDAEGSISISTLGGQSALVLEQEIAGRMFQTWIYHYDGALRELFIASENTPVAGTGQVLVEVYNFTVEKLRDDLIYVSSESESGAYSRMLIGIRSGGQIQ